MKPKIYNTLTKKLEEFEPIRSDEVRMYSCGPTVYGYLHIGNARNAVVFDAFRKFLKTRYGKVTFVQNITDVDDKIIKRANEEGVPWQDIADRYTEAFFEDMWRLGVEPPDHQPKATECIGDMIQLIEQLIQKDLAYAVDGDVYYRVAKWEGYGKLSGRKLEELEAGSRVEVNPRKDHPMDFALWKSAKAGEPSWSSPWGEGRPGWHIECSAMALKYFGGETLDIHAGGSDLIFPHHENEIAQSEAVMGKPFAKYWMHNGMLEFQGAKMSKSVGNILEIREILKSTQPVVVRHFLLSAHYRSSLEYGPKSLASIASSYEELANTFYRLKELGGAKPVAGFANPLSPEFVRSMRIKFTDALENDFNTPQALGVLFQLVGHAKQVIADPKFVLTTPAQISIKTALSALYELTSLIGLAPAIQDVPEEVWELLRKREESRKTKNFAAADQIRLQLLSKGIHVEDTPAGPIPILKAK